MDHRSRYAETRKRQRALRQQKASADSRVRSSPEKKSQRHTHTHTKRNRKVERARKKPNRLWRLGVPEKIKFRGDDPRRTHSGKKKINNQRKLKKIARSAIEEDATPCDEMAGCTHFGFTGQN